MSGQENGEIFSNNKTTPLIRYRNNGDFPRFILSLQDTIICNKLEKRQGPIRLVIVLAAWLVGLRPSPSPDRA
jgi:hypothetical protein